MLIWAKVHVASVLDSNGVQRSQLYQSAAQLKRGCRWLRSRKPLVSQSASDVS
jgi:hypothetical protein